MEIPLAKRLRQKLELVWRRTRSCLDRSRYRRQANLCNKLMSDARRRYYADCINETSDNPRTLWKTINNILHRTQSLSIPAFSDIKSLSKSFSKFFMDKTEKLRMNFINDIHNIPYFQSPTVKSRMTCFEPATVDEARKMIINSPSKTCDLDQIPPELIKSCLDVFPDICKTSHVMHLLKKPSLSKDDMNNYRPVSNLNFVSKIIEKVIANRIRSHQSAYIYEILLY